MQSVDWTAFFTLLGFLGAFVTGVFGFVNHKMDIATKQQADTLDKLNQQLDRQGALLEKQNDQIDRQNKQIDVLTQQIGNLESENSEIRRENSEISEKLSQAIKLLEKNNIDTGGLTS